jgi:hypothetical protein
MCNAISEREEVLWTTDCFEVCVCVSEILGEVYEDFCCIHVFRKGVRQSGHDGNVVGVEDV